MRMKKNSLSQRCRERDAKISRITIHCSPQLSSERMIRVLKYFDNTSYNYFIDKDGKVNEIISEQYGAWSTGSSENDNAAINIMCSLHREDDYYDISTNYMAEIVFNSLIELCADIVKKYGYKQLLWNPNGDYNDAPDDAMIITMHKLVNPYGVGQGCVPKLVEARFGELALRVTEEVKAESEERNDTFY
ncbi:MAG TPA: hypothetical protein DHV37_05975 [Erysipelotrichaceae bacterium]|nr:hypothetical protein [Erysipelotrichaceae bacterium]